MTDLARFKSAQADPASGFEAAARELERGHKTSHWIWYVFPQLAGLGRSPAARHFGLAGRAEAAAYLQDALLRSRLERVTALVARHAAGGVPLRRLMGSDIDALKLVSSLTLFDAVLAKEEPGRAGEFAQHLRAVLAAAEQQGLPRCRFTLAALAADQA